MMEKLVLALLPSATVASAHGWGGHGPGYGYHGGYHYHDNWVGSALIGGVISNAGAVIGNNVGKDRARIEQRNVCRNVPVTVQQGSIVTVNIRVESLLRHLSDNFCLIGYI